MFRSFILLFSLILVFSASANDACLLVDDGENKLTERDRATLKSEGVLLSLSFDEGRVFISDEMLESCKDRIYLQSIFESMVHGIGVEMIEPDTFARKEFNAVLCKALNSSANAWPDGSRHELISAVSEKDFLGVDVCIKERLKEDGYFPIDYVSHDFFLDPSDSFIEFLEARVGSRAESTVSNSALMLFVLKNGGRLDNPTKQHEILTESRMDVGFALGKNEIIDRAEHLLHGCKKITIYEVRQFLQEISGY